MSTDQIAAILTATDVHRSFKGPDYSVSALHRLSFTVNKGEFLAVIGPSGSGKSTLLHILGGLDRPDGGEVTIEDTEIFRLSDDELTRFRRAKTGFVFQHLNLLPALNVSENISMPFLIDGRNTKEDQERIADMIELFGLRDRERRKPHELSMGEQQRVAIARAFLANPAIVIADEPTGSLDPTTGREILQLLWESCDNFDQTILVVTHDPKVAVFADRVLFLKEGSLMDEMELGRREDHDDPSFVADRLQKLGI